eukprot:GFUD01043282.1.p1 GENE.GFUD01043282.1~~GFUD01043282.1.p1  ORF type:complete len:434 (-),score=90.42 GFUD01043282.1:6-1307(-)
MNNKKSIAKLIRVSKESAGTNASNLLLTFTENGKIRADGSTNLVQALINNPEVLHSLEELLLKAKENEDENNNTDAVDVSAVFPLQYPRLPCPPSTPLWKKISSTDFRSILRKMMSALGYGKKGILRLGMGDPPLGWPTNEDIPWENFTGSTRSGFSVSQISNVILSMMTAAGLDPEKHVLVEVKAAWKEIQLQFPLLPCPPSSPLWKKISSDKLSSILRKLLSALGYGRNLRIGMGEPPLGWPINEDVLWANFTGGSKSGFSVSQMSVVILSMMTAVGLDPERHVFVEEEAVVEEIVDIFETNASENEPNNINVDDEVGAEEVIEEVFAQVEIVEEEMSHDDYIKCLETEESVESSLNILVGRDASFVNNQSMCVEPQLMDVVLEQRGEGSVVDSQVVGNVESNQVFTEEGAAEVYKVLSGAQTVEMDHDYF